MYHTNIELLLNIASERKLKVEDIASILDIDRSTFYRRVSNNKLRICDMQKLIEALDLSKEEACLIFLAQ